MSSYDYEEHFHRHERRDSRKERKIAQKMDRSKFKKSDLEKLEKEEIDLCLPRGRVVAITGEGIWVDREEKRLLCTLKGTLKKEKMSQKNLLVVGDFVRFSPLNEKEGSIAHVEERFSFLTRIDISGKKEQLIAANVDQLIIAASLLSPPLKPALIDRYLIAAEKGSLHPILVINKLDLLEKASEEEKLLFANFLAAYEPLGYPILSLSAETGVGMEALRSLLQNKTSVFSGQSGVGKSSLLNACFGLKLKVGDLAVKTQKGSHTTTTAELIALPGGGYCVDTPGIRSFGIWNLQKEDVTSHFSDIASYSKKCKYPDCIHLKEPECAVLRALEKKKIPLLRYESYQILLDEALKSAEKQTWS